MCEGNEFPEPYKLEVVKKPHDGKSNKKIYKLLQEICHFQMKEIVSTRVCQYDTDQLRHKTNIFNQLQA